MWFARCTITHHTRSPTPERLVAPPPPAAPSCLQPGQPSWLRPCAPGPAHGHAGRADGHAAHAAALLPPQPGDAMQCSNIAVQCSTVQYSAVQYTTVMQYSASQCNAVHNNAVHACAHAGRADGHTAHAATLPPPQPGDATTLYGGKRAAAELAIPNTT
jgi:hypothetical protein